MLRTISKILKRRDAIEIGASRTMSEYSMRTRLALSARPVVLALLTVIASSTLLSEITSAASPFGSLPTAQMILKFSEGELVSTPKIVDGYICIDTPSGVDTLSTLPGIVDLEHLSRISTAPRPLEGPWMVTLLVSDFQALSVPSQLPSPHVEYLAPAPGMNQVDGEHVSAWFPESHKTRFCQGQTQLHDHYVGEQPYDWDNSCGVPFQYGFDRDMDLPQAWGITKGSSDVLVAVLDVGFDWMHPELGGDGPPFACATEESLQYYNNGVIFANLNDPLGDASVIAGLDTISVPGRWHYDDDNDGRFDEDSLGRDYRNDRETDVFVGIVDSGTDTTIVDNSAHWLVDE